MTMLVDIVQSEVSRSLISGRKDGLGFGGRYIRSTVMEYGCLHLKARHSIDENSDIGRGDSFISARCMITSPPPRPELQAFSM